MQGKLVCSQSASTFLFLNRFSIAARYLLQAVRQLFRTRKTEEGEQVLPTSPHVSPLLCQGEIRFAAASHGDGLRLILRTLMPDRHRVAAIGNVFDLVGAAVVAFSEIGCRT